jgi:hypothetical protein
MALIKVVCLFFGFLFIVNPLSAIYAKDNAEKLPFDVNQVIEKVTTQQKPYHADFPSRFRRNPHRITESLQGEFMLDTSRVYVPAYGRQWTPSIAFDGINYFVVWIDYNLPAVVGARVNQNGEILDMPGIIITKVDLDLEVGKPTVAFGDNYFVVWVNLDDDKTYGARVNTAGVLLDTAPIRICTTNCEQYYPSVSFGVSDFLVVWDDNRNSDLDIYGTRVSTNGVVLNPTGTPISIAIGHQFCPTVNFGGSNYFVAWEDRRSGTSLDIYGARLNTEGIVLDTTGIQISTTAESQSIPAITFGGNNYFVVWDVSGSDIYGARVTETGTVLDSNGIAISTENNDQSYPSVTFDGTNYFAVWEDYRDECDIYGARISTDGIVLDPNGIEICTTSVADEYVPSVAFGGSNYFVAWTFDEDEIIGARVNVAGTVLDSAGILVSYSVNRQDNSAIAFDGTNYFAVWCDIREDTSYICGTRVNTTGVILDSTCIKISEVVLRHFSPYLQVAYGEGNYLIVWNDFRTTFPDIYAARVSTEGILLDTIKIPLSTVINAQWYPKVIFDGSNYFVVWYDDRGTSSFDIYGARVSLNGVVLDPDGIPISTPNNWQSSPEVIFDGSNYFVCWMDSRNGGSENRDIYGARVSTSGVVFDTAGIPISTANYNQMFQQITFDGTNYFVVWCDQRSGSIYYYDIYGARITPSGVVLDTEGIPISITNNRKYNPRVVFGDNKYFVIWEDLRNETWDVYGTRLTTEGLVLDPDGIPISIGDYDQVYPQVVFDGVYYVAVWQSGIYRYDYDIYGAHVNPVNARIDPFSITTQPSTQNKVAITNGQNNQVFVTYTGWIDSYQGKPYNSYRIWGEFAPAPGVEETKISADINSPVIMNSPNPFNRSTMIKYSVKKSGDISIKIFDITGKLVRNLVNDKKEPGIYSISWDGTNDLRQKLPAGVYFYQLKTPSGISETKEVIILR